MCRLCWIKYTPTWVRIPCYLSVQTEYCNGRTGWFSNTIAYGSVYGYTGILSRLETSYVLVGTLIAVDTPRQIGWHLDNARRGGASLEQARAVRQVAMNASQRAGVRWRNQVPEVKE
jgi:hypothetical protein